MPEWKELEDHEEEIEAPSQELLWRQVTPHIWKGEKGVPADHAFGPSTADEGKPSYSRQKLVSAEEAFNWHNKNANTPSQSVWACSINDISAADLRAIDDNSRVPSRTRAPGHAYVDFRGLNKSQERKKRVHLLLAALDHGVQFPINN